MLDRLRLASCSRGGRGKDLSGGVKIVIIKRSDLRAVGAAVARPPHTRKVTGSNPVLPTICQNNHVYAWLFFISFEKENPKPSYSAK